MRLLLAAILTLTLTQPVGAALKFTSADFIVNRSNMFSYSAKMGGAAIITTTVSASDPDVTVTLVVSWRNGGFQRVTSDPNDETNGKAAPSHPIEPSQSIVLSFGVPVRIDDDSLDNLLRTDTGAEVVSVTSLSFTATAIPVSPSLGLRMVSGLFVLDTNRCGVPWA